MSRKDSYQLMADILEAARMLVEHSVINEEKNDSPFYKTPCWAMADLKDALRAHFEPLPRDPNMAVAESGIYE